MFYENRHHIYPILCFFGNCLCRCAQLQTNLLFSDEEGLQIGLAGQDEDADDLANTDEDFDMTELEGSIIHFLPHCRNIFS